MLMLWCILWVCSLDAGASALMLVRVDACGRANASASALMLVSVAPCASALMLVGVAPCASALMLVGVLVLVH